MSNLPGLSNDKQYLIESEFLTSYYKMFRSYYICLFYLSTKKYNESVGFIFKVETYIMQVEASFSATMAKTQDLNKTDLDASIQELKREVNQSKYKIQSAAILEANDTSNDFNPEFTKDQLDKIVCWLTTKILFQILDLFLNFFKLFYSHSAIDWIFTTRTIIF